MPPRERIEIGPLTQALLDASVWSRDSLFPYWQARADDAEAVLSFLLDQGVLESFRRRFAARESEGAWAEARAGLFLWRNGFRILQWEPRAVPERPGDIDVQYGDTEPVFVEVKGPGWQGELSDEERSRGRKEQSKFEGIEARSVGPSASACYAIDKAIPKFSSHRCNLVVIVDDLYISPVELPEGWLEHDVTEHLVKTPRGSSVGGALFVWVTQSGGPVEYRHRFVRHSAANRPLPASVVERLAAGNWHEEPGVSPLETLGLLPSPGL